MEMATKDFHSKFTDRPDDIIAIMKKLWEDRRADDLHDGNGRNIYDVHSGLRGGRQHACARRV